MDGMMFGPNMQEAMCGGRHEGQMEGYSETINSKELVSFIYNAPKKSYSAMPVENGKLRICCSGGGEYYSRDGSLYNIKYETDDKSILESLQKVIEEYNETRGNGHTVHVDGLPGGIGDLLNCEYASGEKIYKSSNQFPTVRYESQAKIDEIFHEFVLKDGYDFNTKGSNNVFFDDATEDYLDGTWKGVHFGCDVVVTFVKNRVTITVDNKVTDDNVEYIIFDGTVRPNKLREGKEKATREYDYEGFNGASCFSKKNYFTLSAYFVSESGASSSCDLHNFDKKNPEEENNE